jgi:hypothetical protein
LNGQYFDMQATANLRKNLDRARLIVDLVRKREKLKKALWRVDCDLSELRLGKLRVLLEGRILEMQNGRRLTEERLASYRRDLDALLARPLWAREAGEEALLAKKADGLDNSAAAAAGSTAATVVMMEDGKPAAHQKPSGGEVRCVDVDMHKESVAIPDRPLRGDYNTSHSASDAVNDFGDVKGGAMGTDEPDKKRGRGGGFKGGKISTEALQSSLTKTAVTHRKRQEDNVAPLAAVDALVVENAVPAHADVIYDPGRPSKRGRRPMTQSDTGETCLVSAPHLELIKDHAPETSNMTGKRKKGEEEEEEGLLARDRFEALTEGKGLAAATFLAENGSPLWSAAGKRISACGRVDFEKTLALLIDPEDLRRREKGSQAMTPGSFKSKARITLDRQLMELVSALEDCSDGDGRDVSATFEIAPDPEAYPDYYDAVLHPMDLETIRHRVQTLFYVSLADFCKDVHQLVRNAKKFNAPRSRAYIDADFLKGFFEQKKEEVLQKEKEYRTLVQEEEEGQQGKSDGFGRDGGVRAKRRRFAGKDSADCGYDLNRNSGINDIDTRAGKGKHKLKRKGGGGPATRFTRHSHKNKKVCLVCAAGEDDSMPVVAQGQFHTCAECVRARPEAFVGRYVDVLWPDDDTWYAGMVKDFDRASGQHRILYDDGEWEFVFLHEQEMSFPEPVELRPGDLGISLRSPEPAIPLKEASSETRNGGRKLSPVSSQTGLGKAQVALQGSEGKADASGGTCENTNAARGLAGAGVEGPGREMDDEETEDEEERVQKKA